MTYFSEICEMHLSLLFQTALDLRQLGHSACRLIEPDRAISQAETERSHELLRQVLTAGLGLK